MRSMNEDLNTDGVGLWSNQIRTVACTGLEVTFQFDDECDEVASGGTFGELRVYFDQLTWDTVQHGLIYTDKGFMKELKEYLKRAGYNSSDVNFSEQGMQGDDYVSFDVGPKFLKSWNCHA